MERKLQERMVGAGVLVLALVIIGPLVLDGGPRRDVDGESIPGQRSDELHTHTFDLRAPAGSGAGVVPPVTAAPPVAPAATPAPPAAGQPVAAARPAGEGQALAPAQTQAPVPAVARPSTPPPAARPAPLPAADVAKTTAPAPAAPPAVSGGGFLVQVGTFGERDNAERLVATLKGRGFAAALSTATRGGRTLYRVRVGPAGSREAATALAGKLAAAGHAGQVVPQ